MILVNSFFGAGELAAVLTAIGVVSIAAMAYTRIVQEIKSVKDARAGSAPEKVDLSSELAPLSKLNELSRLANIEKKLDALDKLEGLDKLKSLTTKLNGLNKLKELDQLGELTKKMESLERKVARIKVPEAKETGSETNALIAAGLKEASGSGKLNRTGIKIVKQSGVDKILEDNFERMIKAVTKSKPKNIYQANQALTKEVMALKKKRAILFALEEGAYAAGTDVDTVLVASAIHLGPRAMKQLGLA